MPWVIPPWLGLVEFLGLTAKANEHDKHDDDGDDGNSDDNDANLFRMCPGSEATLSAPW